MAKIKADFNSESTKFVPLPVDTYKLQVREEPELTQSRQGNDTVVFDFVVVEAEDSSLNGRHVLDRVVISNTKRRLKQVALAAGVAWDDEGLELEDFVGETLEANVVIEDYKDNDGQDQQTNRISKYHFTDPDEAQAEA